MLEMQWTVGRERVQYYAPKFQNPGPRQHKHVGGSESFRQDPIKHMRIPRHMTMPTGRSDTPQTFFGSIQNVVSYS